MNTDRILHRLIVLLVVVMSSGFATVATAEPWSERLGYPTGSRVVLFNAHEMGLTWETNDAGRKLLADGHIGSLTAMSTGPWFEDFAEWAAQHPDHDIGLHIALTNPYDRIQWRLITPKGIDSSLVDQDGRPWQTAFQLAAHARAEDVEQELHAQIDRARAAGIRPTHLAGYHATIYSRTDLAAVLMRASMKYWIPAPVVELTPEHIERFRRMGYPLEDDLVELVRNYPMPKLDDIKFVPDAATYEEKRDAFCELLRSLPPGLTMIALHPSIPSPGMERLTGYHAQRMWELELLYDEQVQAVLNEQQIIKTDWLRIMQRFESADEPVTEETEVP